MTLDGVAFDVGGLSGQPIDNYLSASWLDQLTNRPSAFHFAGMKTGRTAARFDWKKRREWMSEDAAWPAPGASLTLEFDGPGDLSAVRVEVHYEIYDGLHVDGQMVCPAQRLVTSGITYR